ASFDFLPFDKEAGFKVVEKMREIAGRREASVAQIALAWLLAKPVVASIIVGASKPHQLEDNLGVLKVRLADEQIKELDALTAPTVQYPNWFSNQTVDS